MCMRLPTTRVYRAFPELDEFGNEQCRAWVRSANAGVFRLLARMMLFGAAFLAWLLVVGFASVGVGMWLSILDGRARHEHAVLILLGVAITIGIGFGVVWVLMLRDALLRRRVRGVMEARGSCDKCRYVLVGLPVAEGRVICPECGLARVPNETLAEVVADAGGVLRYLPSAKNVPEVRTRWTLVRRRRAVRIVRWTSIGLVVLVVGALGTYEGLLRWQAAKAAAARPGMQGLIDLAAANQPKSAAPMSANAWDAFDLATNRLWESSNWGMLPRASIWSDVDPAALLDDTETYGVWQQYDPAKFALIRLLATDMLEAGEINGVFDAARGMSTGGRSLRQYVLPVGAPLNKIQADYLGLAHLLIRTNLARMHVAAGRHDLRTYAEALEQNRALVRMLRQEPIWWTTRFACRLDVMVDREVITLLATRPEKEWVDAIKGCVDRQSDIPDVRYALDAERLTVLDTIGWLYSEPEHVRFGSHSPVAAKFLADQLGGGATPTFGIRSFGFERSELEDAYADWVSAYSADAWNRPSFAPMGPKKVSIVGLLTDWTVHPQTLAVWDWHSLMSRGLRVAIALEEYRIERGEYPTALGELVPRYMPTMLVDPWSGGELRYCRHSATDSASGYLLYSVGMDGVDDGGLESATDSTAGVTRSGWDVVVSGEPE
jgi:hypothetical protein